MSREDDDFRRDDDRREDSERERDHHEEPAERERNDERERNEDREGGGGGEGGGGEGDGGEGGSGERRGEGGGGGGDGNKEWGTACRWRDRGFGFIKPESGGEDVFCHSSSILDGNALREGDRIQFVRVYDERKGKERADQVATSEPSMNVTSTPHDPSAGELSKTTWTTGPSDTTDPDSPSSRQNGRS